MKQFATGAERWDNTNDFTKDYEQRYLTIFIFLCRFVVRGPRKSFVLDVVGNGRLLAKGRRSVCTLEGLDKNKGTRH